MLYQDRILPIEAIYTPRVMTPWLHQGRPEDDQALRRSLEALGQLQNVLVVPTGPEHFALIAGRRRYDAARALGWGFLSAKVIAGGPSSARLFAIFLAENLHRLHLDAGTAAVGEEVERRALELVGLEDRPDAGPLPSPMVLRAIAMALDDGSQERP